MELIISLAGLWPSTIHLILLFSVTNIWLPPAANCLSNETDRLALLEFKARISNDPYGIFSSWNDSVRFCRWEGVTCDSKHQRVSSLDLRGRSLLGTLSPYISNLTFLRFLNLSNNRIHGKIPQQIGYLFRLRYLSLTDNKFEGEIPANISYCSNLQFMDLARNNLSGKIPAQLGSLNKLVTFRLNRNDLTGEIPHSLGNLSFIQELSLASNRLQGNIPNDLGRLTSLFFLSIIINNLTGTIPSTIYNLSSLTNLHVTGNKLEGSLPPDIGLTLPKLQRFTIAINQIHGSIPMSLTNASQLQMLDISNNRLTGQVPNNLGYLESTIILNLASNFLGNNASNDLDFMMSLSNCSNLVLFAIYQNNFGGLIPSSIANMPKNIQRLHMGRNQISGKIPTGLGNLVNLYLLDMSVNLLSGPIPDALGKLLKLQGLGFSQNKLSGEIPNSLCNLTQLAEFDLRENKLEGNLIPCIGNFQSLQHLSVSANNLNGSIPLQILDLHSIVHVNLSQNAFTGVFPLGVNKLTSINGIDVSKNKLSGKIPETLGDCLNLEFLYMGGNMFGGDIPSSLASLKGLQELDLSRNNLSGNIPRDLEKLMFLRYLNLSFNNLMGELPTKGVFSNLSAFSVDGNSDICGGIPELQLPTCPVEGNKHKMSVKAIILVAIITPIVIFIAITSLYISYWRKSRKNPSSKESKFLEDNELPRISYHELLQATNGFSSENIIGEGSFGSVYKGNLNPKGENLVAVKVLKLQQHGASKSFLVECKALRNIRHRNLVKILTYCSSIDFKGNDFKALVFDFMENGSLEMWLHPRDDIGNGQPRNLSLLQRLQVVIDVSSALHYLHDNCKTPVLHCDLKPSNILFNGDMTAHVGDFGLAKLKSESTNDFSQSETSSIGLKGTIGYMPPEYGTNNKATKYGDIYSFGIILLEIFTGRRPTDQNFKNGLNLHSFVRSNLNGQVMQVLDPFLLPESLGQDGGEVHDCIVSILEIGLSCSVELPADRMHMGDVNRKLYVIKETFLQSIEAKQPEPSNRGIAV